MRDQLGLGRARWVYTGGAPLGPDTYRFFRSFGINLKQVWGSTELSGLASLQRDGEADPDTVGPAIPGAEIRIAADGEVLVRSAAVFCGYNKDPEASGAAVDAEGWFRTGDCGFLDRRGHLVVVDRASDVGKLADGTPFAPQFVENKLKFSPYIAEAVAFGDRRAFVAAMIVIDLGTVGNWAERHGLAYTSFQDLSAKPEIRRLIGEEIARCNAGLPAAVQIRRFLLLNKEFDADDSEITRTRKVRRRFIAEKYAAAVEALYGAADQIELITEITYEDGRKAALAASIAIDTVAGAAGRRRASPLSPEPSDGRDRLAVHPGPGHERGHDRADVRADRAGIRADLQGDRRDQFRPGRVRHVRRLYLPPGPAISAGCRSGRRPCWRSSAWWVSASGSSASCCGR